VTKRHVPLGRLVITPNAQAALSGERVIAAVEGHITCQWGDAIAPGDRRANDQALTHGDRVMSVWHVDPSDPSQGTFWVITEADRASTCVLMPDDY